MEIEFTDKFQFLFKPSRYKVAYGGRGGLKSWAFARALLLKGSWNPLLILCTRELQNSIKESVHRLLSNQIEVLGLERFYEVQNTAIKGLNGTEFSFEGMKHNYTKIKSYEGVDIVWIEEADKTSKGSMKVLVPTIRKPNSEIWMSFNPEFEDDYVYEEYVLNPPKSATVVFTTYKDNPWFPDVLEQERLTMLERDPDSYDHVWGGKCRQWLEGAIYSNELRAVFDEGRITEVPFDPHVPVFTAWDLGRTDDTAIWWFQLVSGEIHIIESYAYSGGDPSHFASQILGKRVTIDIIGGQLVVEVGEDIPDLEHRRSYEYETHWLPHDAKAKTLAAHGKSTEQQLRRAIGHIKIVKNLDREDGIKIARSTFPRCWFDRDKTSDGLKALRKYQRELQPDEISLKAAPKHDWTSHYADAFRYLSIAWREDSAPVDDGNHKPDAYGEDDDGQDWQSE